MSIIAIQFQKDPSGPIGTKKGRQGGGGITLTGRLELKIMKYNI